MNAQTLPKDLLYLVNTVAGYSKNIIKLNVQNTTTLSSAGATQMRVSMPTNTIVNMQSVSFHSTFKTKGVAATSAGGAVYGLIPRGGVAAVIDRCSFSLGGVAMDSSPSNYGLVYMMKQNLEKSTSKYMSDDGILGGATVLPFVAGESTYGDANHGQSRQMVMNNMLGFSELSPCWLDMSLVPEAVITIQIDSTASTIPVMFEGTTLGVTVPSVVNTNFGTSYYGSGCTYTLEDCYFTCQVLSIGSGVYNALVARVLQEQRSIDIPFKSYQVITQSQSSPGGSIRGSVSTMSLDAVYAVQRNATTTPIATPTDVKYGAAAWNLQQPPLLIVGNYGFGSTQAAHVFTSVGVASAACSINNAPYPLFNATPLDCANIMIQSNNRCASKTGGGLLGSLNAWLYHGFTFMMRLNHSSDVSLVSGLNLSSVNAQIGYNTTEDSDTTAGAHTARQVILITESTSLLRIGESRSLAVIS